MNGTLDYVNDGPVGNDMIQGYDSASEYFATGGSVSSSLMTIYRYAQSYVEGDYVIRRVNSGNKVLNGTFLLGYSLESFERPLLIVGLLSFATAATLGLVTAALYVHYLNRHPSA